MKNVFSLFHNLGLCDSVQKIRKVIKTTLSGTPDSALRLSLTLARTSSPVRWPRSNLGADHYEKNCVTYVNIHKILYDFCNCCLRRLKCSLRSFCVVYVKYIFSLRTFKYFDFHWFPKMQPTKWPLRRFLTLYVVHPTKRSLRRFFVLYVKHSTKCTLRNEHPTWKRLFSTSKKMISTSYDNTLRQTLYEMTST